MKIIVLTVFTDLREVSSLMRCGQVVSGKLPPGLVGTPVLIDKLTQILFKHIRRFLPEIKKDRCADRFMAVAQ